MCLHPFQVEHSAGREGLDPVGHCRPSAAGSGLSGGKYRRECQPEGLGKGYTDGFVIDFADAAARDAYLVHPAHEKAGGRIVAAAEGGIGGVLVYDFEMAG